MKVRLSDLFPTEYPKRPRTKTRRKTMSDPEYIKAYGFMNDRQKEAMHDLWMKGWNSENGVWVRYKEVEKAVAEIVMASLEENDD